MVLEEKQRLEIRTEMNEETYRYFISGLRQAIREAGYKYEKDFAEGIMHPVTLSNNLNGKQTMDEANIEKCLKKLNKEESEIVAKGKRYEGVDLDTEREDAHRNADLGDTVASLVRAITAFREIERNNLFWQSCIDAMPVPVCVVDSSGVVIFQNQADKSLYKMNVVGEKLCPACRDNKDIPHPCDDCSVKKVVELGEPVKRRFEMDGIYYKITSSPLKTPKGMFVVITVVEESKRG